MIFNNPERHNAMSLEMWEAHGRHPRRIRQGQECASWCSPAPAARLSFRAPIFPSSRTSAQSEEAIALYNATVERRYATVHDFPKPTIAMIRGYCIGGGLGLAVCCDMRICSDNSKFGVPAAKLGLGYGYPGLKRLFDLVGPSFAKEIFFTRASSTRGGAARWASSTGSCPTTSSRPM